MAQVKVFSLGGIGSPCCCTGVPLHTCGPCDVPNFDLTISESGTGTFSSFNDGPWTLQKTGGAGAGYWSTVINRRTFGSMLYFYWDMICSANAPGVFIRYYSGLTSPPATLSFSSNPADGAPTQQMTTDSLTCGSNFLWTLHICAANNCAIGRWDWTISYP